VRHALATLALLACAACTATGGSGTPAAALQVGGGDLVAELAACDAVAPTDPGYPEARSRALQVESRLRESHQLLHEGLLLRSEGRDESALHCFRAARAIWPAMPGLEDWIRATEARQRIFVASAPDPVRAMELDGAHAAVPAPLAETAAPTALRPASADQLLATARAHLERGEPDAAVAALRGPGGRAPAETWRRDALAQVLRQRGLLAYGRGDLDRAVSDWSEALDLAPSAIDVRRWLSAARAEQQTAGNTHAATAR
jgi:tetratricopeptide (TPR) repeat protein